MADLFAEPTPQVKRFNDLEEVEADLRRTMEALREGEETFRKLVDLSRDGMYMQVEGHFVYANTALAKMVGLSSPYELIGRQVLKLFQPDCRSVVKERIAEATETGEQLPPVSLKIAGLNGESLDVEVVETAHVYQGKKSTLAVVRDVGEVRRLEEQLVKSVLRHRASPESSSQGFLILTEVGLITYADDRFAELIGCSENQIVGAFVSEFMDEANKTIFGGEFFNLKKSRPRGLCGITLTGKDGRKAPVIVSFNGLYDGEASFKGAFATFLGITDSNRERQIMGQGWDALEQRVEARTADLRRANEMLLQEVGERKRAEEALRVSQERLRAIFEVAQDCIYIKDTDYRFVQVNPAMERMLGLPASQICGRTAEDIYGEEAGKHIREVVTRVLSGESVEEEHSRPVNGVMRTFHDIRVPLRNGSGEIIGLCGIARDITERRRARPATRTGAGAYASVAMSSALAKARQAAPTDGIVLLVGESGSGKDHMARWVHKHSRRAAGPFFSINCAAVPQELAESELFGHEPGAFTGARGRKRGMLELAEGGTLLLNEIGELSLAVQSKLLSFMDERSFLRVGGEKRISVNARLMAATHRDLEAEVANGRFLQALWYRLNVFSIEVPPLRERIDDIPTLVEELMARLAIEMHLPEVPAIDSVGMESLCRYHWPGNVRELRNVLERALMLSEESRLKVSLPLLTASQEEWSYKVVFPEGRGLREITDEVIISLCEEALRRCGGNRGEAARMLEISRTGLYRFMKRLGPVRDYETE